MTPRARHNWRCANSRIIIYISHCDIAYLSSQFRPYTYICISADFQYFLARKLEKREGLREFQRRPVTSGGSGGHSGKERSVTHHTINIPDREISETVKRLILSLKNFNVISTRS